MFVQFSKPANKNVIKCSSVYIGFKEQELNIYKVASVELLKTAILITLENGKVAKVPVAPLATVKLYDENNVYTLEFKTFERYAKGTTVQFTKLIAIQM